MRVTPAIPITDAIITSTTVVEIPPAAYVGGNPYPLGATVSVGTVGQLLTVYLSLQADNVDHDPASSPSWWENIGTTYAVYDPGFSYAAGDMVIDPVAHLVYESQQAANSGHALATEPTWWLKRGITNSRAMFDLLRNTQTTAPGSLSVTFTPPSRVDSLALAGVAATAAEVTVRFGGKTVYSTVKKLIRREVSGWRDYFFAPFTIQSGLVLYDLPPYIGAEITITLSAPNGSVACGAVGFGSSVYLGVTQYDPESDTLNFSTVDRDEFGKAEMTPIRNVPKASVKTILDKRLVNKARAVRAALDATPAFWSGLDDLSHPYAEALFLLGFYRKFTIRLPDYDAAEITLDLEEV